MSPLALSLHFLQAQPDDRLVALARDGHEPAFEALVRRYRKELLSYCRRLQPHSGGAEDALQQTLLQAWRALSAGAEVKAVRPWLYRIAHNVTLNNLRVAVAIPQEIPDVAGGHEVGQLVEQRLLARAALAGMASLPEVQRQAFISTTLDGASHDEVARTLGLSSGAVRGLIYRARATLRAAAAAITPSPFVHWAIGRAERGPNAPAIAETLAGGGGAGVAAVLAKGAAVLTLAGAVASTSGVILARHSGRRHHGHEQLSQSLARRQPSLSADRVSLGPGTPPLSADRVGLGPRTLALAATHRSLSGRSASVAHAPAHPREDRSGRHRSAIGEGRSDPGGPSSGKVTSRSDGSDSGSSGSSGSSDSSRSGATVASSSNGSSGRSPGESTASSGRDDGGSSGSDGGSTSSTPESGGATSGARPGPSDGGQLTTVETTSNGASGSDGGSGGSGTSSGSGDGTNTTGSH